MKAAETDLEKLKAIESYLSSFTYTLTPGDLPEGVKEAGDFLDYFLENYEGVVYGGKTADEEQIKEAVKDREGLLELLKQERKWVWICYRIRLCLGKYRFKKMQRRPYKCSGNRRSICVWNNLWQTF